MSLISSVRQKVRHWLGRDKVDRAMEKRASGNRSVRRRYKRAAERLMENSSLRDELDDEKAKEMLDWGSGYLKKVADSTAELPKETADNILENETERISGMMRQVNRLTRAINLKDKELLLDEYESLTKKIDALRTTSEDVSVTVDAWLPLSEDNNTWVQKQLKLKTLLDGEEE